MLVGTHAVLREIEGRTALCFARTFPHPVEKLWSALTEHDELFNWHPTPFTLESHIGGEVRFSATDGAPQMPVGRVLTYEPPRSLAYTWGGDELRFELSSEGEGCMLRLTHLFDDRFKAARDGAGWHLCLDALTQALAGKADPQRGATPHLPKNWQKLNDEYQRRFGIAAEQATPVPQH